LQINLLFFRGCPDLFSHSKVKTPQNIQLVGHEVAEANLKKSWF